MAYNKDIPYNDLPDLPPVTFTESSELLRHLAKASRYLGKLNGVHAVKLGYCLPLKYLKSAVHQKSISR